MKIKKGLEVGMCSSMAIVSTLMHRNNENVLNEEARNGFSVFAHRMKIRWERNTGKAVPTKRVRDR